MGETRKKRFRQFIICAALCAGIAGCSSDTTPPAPIVAVGSGNSSAKATTPVANTPVQSPVATSTPLPERPKVSSSTQSTVSTISASVPDTAIPTSQPLKTENGRIVYNRSYDNIPKGSYGGETYTVKRGDTLFYIAWITGNDFRDLAQRNGMTEPYSLNVGQVLKVGDGQQTQGGMLASKNVTTENVQPPPISGGMQTASVDSASSKAYSSSTSSTSSGKMLPSNTVSTATVAAASTPAVTTTVTSSSKSTVSSGSVKSWKWPAEGKLIDAYSTSEGGNKGIDIGGSRGQSIFAAADGKVVYAGNALRGYGNLIIIKHNDDYLSAYAHNETMLVKEQQEVKAGQKIATMGSTGTSSVRLHFEIRYKGKSVNPLQYLPQR